MGKYVLVAWSDNVQAFMEYPWFKDECILDINSPSDYLVPIKRYKQVMNDRKMSLPNTLLKSALATLEDLYANQDPDGIYADSTLPGEIKAYLDTQFIPSY